MITVCDEYNDVNRAAFRPKTYIQAPDTLIHIHSELRASFEDLLNTLSFRALNVCFGAGNARTNK